jgi:hypothetical protein
MRRRRVPAGRNVSTDSKNIQLDEARIDMPEKEEVEVAIPAKKTIPVFDQSADTGETASETGRFLTQGEHFFTYAEFNRSQKRWIPDPVWVDRTKIAADDMKTRLNSILKKMSDLDKTLLKVQKEILENTELFGNGK